MSFAYSGFLEAARISDGFVVASWGLYLPMAMVVCQSTACTETSSPYGRYILAKSPESHTTTYKTKNQFIVGRTDIGIGQDRTYGAGGLELIQRVRHVCRR